MKEGKKMEITFTINDEINTLNLKQNIIFFGNDTIFKRNYINTLVNKFNTKNSEILVNGLKINTEEYKIIFIDDEDDFSNEFKFAKNNFIKQFIYEDIIKTINEEKILNYANEIFDTIDAKVNKILNKKINKKMDNQLLLDIEINDINTIIDKFTNIYLDNLLIINKDIPKNTKKKLLYKIYFSEIKKHTDKQVIIIINNFDAFLNSQDTIALLNEIDNISNEHIHFILTTNKNIFEYINLEKYCIYKLSEKLIELKTIRQGIKNFLIKNEYENNNNNDIEYETFYNNYEHLITNDDIKQILNELIDNNYNVINKILNSENIKLVKNHPSKIDTEYLIYKNAKEKLLFEEICKIFLTID